MRPVTSTVVTGSCSRCSALALLALALASGCGKKKDNEGGDQPKVVPPPTVPEPTGPVKPRTPLQADPNQSEGKLAWAVSFGGADRDEAKAVDIDDKGNVAVAGVFTGEVDFGTGSKLVSKDAGGFVGLLAADGGKPKWMVPLTAHLITKDPAAEPQVADVTVSDVVFDGKGNVVVVGWFSNILEVGAIKVKATGADDAFVAVIDPAGKPLWAKALGGPNVDIAWGVDADAQGGVVVVGEKRGAADFGGGEIEPKGSADIWVVRLSNDGTHLWSKAFGDMGEDNGRAVALDSRGDVTLAVEMDMALDFGDGKPLAHKGKGDVAVVKLSAAGNFKWARSFGNTFDDVVLGLAIDGADNIFVSGAFEDKLKVGKDKLVSGERADAYVVKMDPDGEVLWAKSFGGPWEDMAAGVAADRYGNVVVTGWFQGKVDLGAGAVEAPNGNMDGFLMKLGPDGKHLWSRRFGDKDHDRGRAVAVDPSGNIALGGIYRFSLDLGGSVLTSATKAGDKIAPADAFFARFGP